MRITRPIVVVGSINMDLVTRVERIPVGGETVSGFGFQTHSGGKGANQAVAIGRLGHPVSLIGRVGSDVFGDELKARIREANVDISGVRSVPGPSGVATIVVAEGGENCIVVAPGGNAALTPEEMELHRDAIRAAGMVLVQLETPIDTLVSIAAMCREFDVPLMLDPAPALPLPAGLIDMTAWLTPNETEARFYSATAEADPQSIVARLREQGAHDIVLKMGANGVYVSRHVGEDRLVEAFKVDAVDTTAAGDTFNGAFAVSLMLGHDAFESARFAAAAAAISVTRWGAQPSMPTMQEVETFLRVRSAAPSA